MMDRILAQAQEQPQTHWFWNPFTLIFVIFGLMWLMIIRPQRKQEAARRAMISGVQKHDRILTNGGIYGVVTNVRENSDEVTVRVQEKPNEVKLVISRNAIATVVSRKGEEQKD